ncbi:unnamed protein product [Caenorhabditis auriculariae]|uniref:Uncharacterized protein n=1 Tax=Caenorhabditis auriculariae TaxID=2777116 RepID=A0A8S1HPP2_9PELO|nr:unnamed protein product [Caenorhabditis auriculariae]
MEKSEPECSIKKRLPSNENGTPKELHSLPCKIDYTGPANVSGYFIRENSADGKEKEANFRGRGLQGVDYHFPDDYKLYVLKKREGDRDQYDIEAEYKQVTTWEWDRSPGADGSRTSLARAFTYLQAAKLLATD